MPTGNTAVRVTGDGRCSFLTVQSLSSRVRIRSNYTGVNAGSIRTPSTNPWDIDVRIERLDLNIGEERIAQTWYFLTVHFDWMMGRRAHHFTRATTRALAIIDYHGLNDARNSFNGSYHTAIPKQHRGPPGCSQGFQQLTPGSTLSFYLM
jgi:hypothetical protein